MGAHPAAPNQLKGDNLGVPPNKDRFGATCMSPLCSEALRLGPLPMSFFEARGRKRPTEDEYSLLRRACGLEFLDRRRRSNSADL